MSLASFFPQTVASRSPLSPIPSQNVFRNLSIDGARLGYHVRLDRGVEADRALRRFAVPPVHLSSHLCRCRAVPQVTLPFFLAHTVCWVRKVSECCRLLCCTRVHSIKDFVLHKELEGGVYGSIKDFGTSFFGCQLVCWSSATSATSVAFWLVTLPFLKIYAALNLVLSPSLNSIPSILNFLDILSNIGFLNVKFCQLFSSYLLYMGGSKPHISCSPVICCGSL